MSERPTIADVLSRAADLIEPEGAWTQGVYARSASGRDLDADDESAVCWCLRGALWRVAGNIETQAENIMAKTVGLKRGSVGWLAAWNDAPERTQAEVVAALRESAKRAAQ